MMDGWAISGIFAAVLALLCLVWIFLYVKRDHSPKRAEVPDEPEDTELHVRVVDLYCTVGSIGIKSPKTAKNFCVCFEDDDGKIMKISVEEAMYEGFEKGQVGVLTLLDGEVYGFALDED